MYQISLSKKFYEEDLFSPKFSDFYYHSTAHRPKNDKITKAAKTCAQRKKNSIVVQDAENHSFP